MPATSFLKIKTRKGVLSAILTGNAQDGFLSLASSVYVNQPGVTTFTLHANHPVIAELELDSQIEHWRNGSMFFRTLYQGPQYTISEDGKEIFTAVCAGEKHLLSRAAVMWPKDVSNRSFFVEAAGETIMHDLVQYNITADALEINGRLVSNPSRYIIVEPDTARGTILAQRDSSGKGLLEELQSVAEASSVDFDLIQVAPFLWLFRMYAPQLGTDRSNKIIFQKESANIHTLAYDATQTDTKNVAVIGGQGEGDAREFVTRYGPDYDPDNHREVLIADTSVEFDSLLAAEADKQLETFRPKKSIVFDARQITNTVFGVDYFLGDIVSARYRDILTKYKVIGATITLQVGSLEQINIELKQL